MRIVAVWHSYWSLLTALKSLTQKIVVCNSHRTLLDAFLVFIKPFFNFLGLKLEYAFPSVDCAGANRARASDAEELEGDCALLSGLLFSSASDPCWRRIKETCHFSISNILFRSSSSYCSFFWATIPATATTCWLHLSISCARWSSTFSIYSHRVRVSITIRVKGKGKG